MRYILTSSVLLLSLALGGCVFAPGDSDRDWDDRDSVRPTIGQELLDLDRARDAGVISTGEYERAKARILEEN
ncbi:MAG: SHOCT domain-containing protein [Pseudomonadota bacterium]